MLNNGNSTTAYNDFSKLPLFPYKIIEYLIKYGSQEFWKLLKYQTVDALDQNDLTIKEKKELIWDGKNTEEQNYNVFLKPLVTNTLDDAESHCQIRLYRYDTVPENHLSAIIIYQLDIITPEKCANVYYEDVLCERTDLLETFLLNDLNGCDLGGTNSLMFDRTLSRTCKSLINISNSKSFYGRSLFIGQRLTNPTTDGGCG